MQTELDATKIRRKTHHVKCVVTMPRFSTQTVGQRTVAVTLPYVSFIDRPDIASEEPVQ